jgi:hypothetical protein
MSSKSEEKRDILCPHCGKEKLRPHASYPELEFCPSPNDGYYGSEVVKGCGYIYVKGEYKKELCSPYPGVVDLR